MKTRLIAVLTPAIAALAFAVPAGAATSEVSSEAVSENWAGYEATSTNSDGFSAVSGSWKVPTVNASTPSSYSAYWVGLGGGEQNSQALEQEGTQADVSANGTVSYYAWYELVPAAPVKIAMTVKPGDTIAARTVVKGDKVTVTVDNKTTGDDFTKTLTMANPDTSTAEWVAEAPSECQGSAEGNCSVLPLADFGTVNFTDAHARSDGQVKSISGWNSEAIMMSPGSSSSEFGYGGGYGGGFGGGFGEAEDSSGTGSSSQGAAPGDLSSDGTSFSVTYGSDQAVASSTSTGSGESTSTTGSGYGAGSGEGESGYGTSGYGEGDSGYGQSAEGYGTSGYGTSGYGASGYGESGYGESGYGDSGYGDSGYGGYGDSAYGESPYSVTGTDGYGYSYGSYGSPYLLSSGAGFSEAYYSSGSANGISLWSL